MKKFRKESNLENKKMFQWNRLSGINENTSGRWPWNRVHQALLDEALQGERVGTSESKPTTNYKLRTTNCELNIRPVSRIFITLLLLLNFLNTAILLAEDVNIPSPIEETSSQQTQKTIEIEFVTVGDEGNLPFHQSSGDLIGSVAQCYEIGKYDVTAEQYCVFLNAMAQYDFYGLYDSKMGSDPDVACIERHGSVGHYTYSIIEDGKNRGQFPITYVTWESAARFCNWLTNGQPEGSEKLGTTIRSLAGATVMYRLPTLHEWYKAAYYKGDGTNAGYWLYATQSNDLPHNRIGNEPNQINYYYGKSLDYRKNYAVRSQPRLTPVGIFSGSAGYYGTFDIAGDVRQWLDETLFEDACGNIGWLKPGSPRPTSEPNSLNRYMFYHYASGISWCYEDSWSDPSRESHDHTFHLPWEGEAYRDSTIGFRVVRIRR